MLSADVSYACLFLLLDVLQIINTVAVCPFGALPRLGDRNGIWPVQSLLQLSPKVLSLTCLTQPAVTRGNWPV